jgi:hypothetical protein
VASRQLTLCREAHPPKDKIQNRRALFSDEHAIAFTVQADIAAMESPAATPFAFLFQHKRDGGAI